MLKFKTTPAKILTTAALCTLTLGACQTTQSDFTKKKVVSLEETNIELPRELLDLKGFKVKEAVIYEDASYHRELVRFTGGVFYYDQYYRGGFYQITPTRFKKKIANNFKNASHVGEIKNTRFKIGDTFYTTVNVEDHTCMVIYGNYGTTVALKGGTGYTGFTYGYYCQPGDHPNIQDTVLPWLKKIHIR